jgi:hypothetical protein
MHAYRLLLLNGDFWDLNMFYWKLTNFQIPQNTETTKFLAFPTGNNPLPKEIGHAHR